MRNRAGIVFLLVLSIGAACFGQTPGALDDPAVTQLLPPDAGLLIGIEWRRTLASASGAAIQKAWTGLPAAGPQFSQLAQALTEDVDSILLAGSAQTLVRPADELTMLVIVRGRFNAERLRLWFPGKSERVGGVEVITPSNVKPADSRLALLDAGTVLFGDRGELLAAIRRRSAPPAARTASPLLGRASALAAANDFWVAMEAPPGGFKPPAASPAAATTPDVQFISQLTGLDLGLSFTSGFGLDASLRAKSEPAAQQLRIAVQGLIAMAAMNSQENPESAEMLKKVQISQAGPAVRINLRLTGEEMAQSVARLQAARANPALAAGPAARPAEPRRAQPGKIRIVGADATPVEVPVKPAQ
jgi:hypothetical protein